MRFLSASLLVAALFGGLLVGTLMKDPVKAQGAPSSMSVAQCYIRFLTQVGSDTAANYLADACEVVDRHATGDAAR